MKKSQWVKLAILFLTASTLSGCIWWPYDDGDRRGGYYERDGGRHHGDRHEDRYEERR